MLLLVPFYVGYAQENIQSTVNVTRDYQAKMMDVQKSKFNTSFSDSLWKLNLNFDYSVFNSPYKDLYEFSPLNGLSLGKKGDIDYPNLYIKGALSYPLMPQGVVRFQPRLSGGHSLVLSVDHNSFWGNKTATDPMNRSLTSGELGYGYNWTKGEVRVDGFYQHNYYQDKPSEGFYLGSHTTQVVGGKALVRSLGGDDSRFDYHLDMNYAYTGFDNVQLAENYIEGKLELGYKVAKGHRVGVGVNLEHSIFSNTQNGLFDVVPQYGYTTDRLMLTAGIGISALYGASKDQKIANVYPKVKVMYELIKDALWVAGEIDGDNDLMSAFELQGRNPWLANMDISAYSIPIRAMASLSGSAGDIFGYSVKGGYVKHNQLLAFCGTAAGYQEQVTVENVNEINVQAEMVLKSESIDFKIGGLYRHFGETFVPMVPKFQADGSFEYNYKKRIYAEVGAKYYSAMQGNGVSYDGFVDLKANVSYVINSKFTAFVQGKNLLNNKIYYLQDYIEPGVNFGLGVLIKL